MRIALAILIGVSITGEADSSSHGIDVSAHIHNGLARRGDRVALVMAEQGKRVRPGFEWQQRSELAAMWSISGRHVRARHQGVASIAVLEGCDGDNSREGWYQSKHQGSVIQTSLGRRGLS